MTLTKWTGIELTDLNFMTELYSCNADGSSSACSTGGIWLVHGYAPFDATAQRTNVLIEKHLTPTLSRARQDERNDMTRVYVSRLDMTRNPQAAKKIFSIDDDASVGSTLMILRPDLDDGGQAAEYRGPRTRQGIKHMLQLLQAGESPIVASNADVMPVNMLQTHKEIQLFLQEHPLAFVLGRTEEGAVTEEEITFRDTCLAMSWQNCAVVPSKRALLRAAVASLSESLEDNHQGPVIAKLDRVRDALLYRNNASTSLEDWMLLHGFPLVSHLDLDSPHLERFILPKPQTRQETEGHKHGPEQGVRQLVIATIQPLNDSDSEVAAVLDALDNAARHNPAVRFGYTTAAGPKGWSAFLNRHFALDDHEVEKLSSSRLFFYDCHQRALYEGGTGAENLKLLLEQVEERTQSPRHLTPRARSHAEGRGVKDDDEGGGIKTTKEVECDEGMPKIESEASWRLVLHALVAACAAVLALTLLVVTSLKKTFAGAGASVKAAEVKQEEETVATQDLPQTKTSAMKDANSRKMRLAEIAESLD